MLLRNSVRKVHGIESSAKDELFKPPCPSSSSLLSLSSSSSFIPQSPILQGWIKLGGGRSLHISPAAFCDPCQTHLMPRLWMPKLPHAPWHCKNNEITTINSLHYPGLNSTHLLPLLRLPLGCTSLVLTFLPGNRPHLSIAGGVLVALSILHTIHTPSLDRNVPG